MFSSLEKIKLQNWLYQTLINIINITIYVENITVRLRVLYIFNKYVKFCINQILFTI